MGRSWQRSPASWIRMFATRAQYSHFEGTSDQQSYTLTLFLPLFTSICIHLAVSLPHLWQGPCGMKYETVCREKPKHSNRSESETCRRKVQRVQPEPNIKCNQWKRRIISGSWIVLIHNLNTWGFPWNKEIKTHTLTIHLFCSLRLFLTLSSLIWSALESILSFFYKLCPPVLYILSYQQNLKTMF